MYGDYMSILIIVCLAIVSNYLNKLFPSTRHKRYQFSMNINLMFAVTTFSFRESHMVHQKRNYVNERIDDDTEIDLNVINYKLVKDTSGCWSLGKILKINELFIFVVMNYSWKILAFGLYLFTAITTRTYVCVLFFKCKFGPQDQQLHNN